MPHHIIHNLSDQEEHDIMYDEVNIPKDLELRLIQSLTEDIDNRLKELTQLVKLQEMELAFFELVIIGMILYNIKNYTMKGIAEWAKNRV
jgi:hypothetical protein